jgi:hypothetical protein
MEDDSDGSDVEVLEPDDQDDVDDEEEEEDQDIDDEEEEEDQDIDDEEEEDDEDDEDDEDQYVDVEGEGEVRPMIGSTPISSNTKWNSAKHIPNNLSPIFDHNNATKAKNYVYKDTAKMEGNRNIDRRTDGNRNTDRWTEGQMDENRGPRHNNIYSSGDYFQLEEAVVMRVDFKNDRKERGVYFPENGPYRCEICETIVKTNVQFYQHVKRMHSGMADETALNIMEEQLNL